LTSCPTICEQHTITGLDAERVQFANAERRSDGDDLTLDQFFLHRIRYENTARRLRFRLDTAKQEAVP